MATSWATSREKSYRISMPRCLPTSAAEWIPGVVERRRRGSFDFFCATRNSWEIPDRPNFLRKPRRDGTPFHLPAVASRGISKRNLGLRFHLHTRVSSLPRATFNSHVFACAAGAIRTLHTQAVPEVVSLADGLSRRKGFFDEFEIDIFVSTRIPMKHLF